jgi:hypothetical protein
MSDDGFLTDDQIADMLNHEQDLRIVRQQAELIRAVWHELRIPDNGERISEDHATIIAAEWVAKALGHEYED